MSAHSRSMFTLSAAVLAAFTLVGCATSASRGSARDVTITSSGPPADRYDSLRRFEQMDRVTMQIVRGTAATTDVDYQDRVRPALPYRLASLGFSSDEIRQILTRVDDARADRQRVRRWWAGVTGSTQPEAHARR